MSEPLSPPPTVTASGDRSSIEVPSSRAANLLSYLRRKGVCCDPPSPCSSGLERIILHRSADAEKVQALLGVWTQSFAGGP